ncbi:unnamed protein product [Ophioblennius macclurei]
MHALSHPLSTGWLSCWLARWLVLELLRLLQPWPSALLFCSVRLAPSGVQPAMAPVALCCSHRLPSALCTTPSGPVLPGSVLVLTRPRSCPGPHAPTGPVLPGSCLVLPSSHGLASTLVL